MARRERPDDPDQEVDPHAADRERRRAAERSGMQVTGRSTRSLLPGLIARRGRRTSGPSAARTGDAGDDDADGR